MELCNGQQISASKISETASIKGGKAKVKDGLSKKERRAQRVAAAGKTTEKDHCLQNKQNSCDDQVISEPTTNKKSNFVAKSVVIVPNHNEIDSSSNLKVSDVKENKGEPATSGPSKAQLRAQRKAIQDAQREAKANKKTSETAVPVVKEVISVKPPLPSTASIENEPHVVKQLANKKKRITQFFKHLNLDCLNFDSLGFPLNDIHAEFGSLGSEFWYQTTVGSNARCLGMLRAIKWLIKDFEVPLNQDFYRSFEALLKKNVAFLSKCRPLAESMKSALSFLNMYLTREVSKGNDNESNEKKKKEDLISFIDKFVAEQILKAGKSITLKVVKEITDSDVILIYGGSSLIRRIILAAHAENKRFEVIIADSSSVLEGQKSLKVFLNAGIKCTYISVNSIYYFISSVTKVLLGAHAVLSNGFVLSRRGTAHVALAGRQYNKPVKVCCETYKFSDRSQTDALTYNELCDVNRLIEKHDPSLTLRNWETSKNLNLINFMYDVTPPSLVTCLVTEVTVLSCNSVPAALRLRSQKYESMLR